MNEGKTFSLRVVRDNVHQQIATSNKLLDYVERLTALQESVDDPDLKAQINDISEELAKTTENIIASASEVGKEVVDYVSGP